VGDILFRLENRELTTEYRDLLLAIEQSNSRHTLLLNKRKLGEAQIELRNRESFEEQLAELQLRVDSLDVRATVSGRLIARRLPERIGMWIEDGEALATIGSDDHKEVLAAIHQQDVDSFTAAVGSKLLIRTTAHGLIEGELIRVSPRATTTPIHDGLTALYDGPLPVKPVETKSNDALESELIQPRFTATITLPPTLAPQLHAGERSDARLSATRPPAALLAYRAASTWLRDRLRDAEAASQP